MAERTEESHVEIIRIPQQIASLADEVVAIALRAADRLSSKVVGDAEAGAELARAAARGARGLAELNASP